MTEKKTNIKFLTIIGIIFILFFVKPEIGQSQKALSIGGKKWGIAFGNPVDYNGIRLNLIDLKTPKKINGLSISIKNESNIVNGIKIGIFNSPKGICFKDKSNHSPFYQQLNGLQIGIVNSHLVGLNGICLGAINKGGTINGINLSLLYSHVAKVNGISICPINSATFINGIQIGLFNKTNNWSSLGSCNEGGGPDRAGICKGIQFALCNFNEGEFLGIQLGIINYNNNAKGIGFGLINICNSGQSVQFGIFNFRKNNRWFAKILPIVNFKMDKKVIKEKDKKKVKRKKNIKLMDVIQ